MKNMKKQLACSVLCLALLLIMMLSTTVAWFSDSAYTSNTMVVGKISITQTVVDTQVVMMPTVSHDRTATITNDGNQPAYVRTVFAFEDVDATASDNVIDCLVSYLNISGAAIEIPGITSRDEKIQFTANGVTYTVGYYTHGLLAAGDSYTCLNAVQLDETAPNEWNEAAGAQYEILVLSQAVQVEGLGNDPVDALDTVFGNIPEKAATWFNAVLN